MTETGVYRTFIGCSATTTYPTLDAMKKHSSWAGFELLHTSPNGWHTIRLHGLPGYGWSALSVMVRYRSHRVRCCGRTVTVAAASRPPVEVADPYTSFARVVPAPGRCRGCGHLYVAAYTARTSLVPYSWPYAHVRRAEWALPSGDPWRKGGPAEGGAGQGARLAVV